MIPISTIITGHLNSLNCIIPPPPKATKALTLPILPGGGTSTHQSHYCLFTVSLAFPQRPICRPFFPVKEITTKLTTPGISMVSITQLIKEHFLI